MLGIDTNVLVRLLVADDAAQTRKARLLVEKCVARHEAVLVSLPVIVEVEWVLRSRYELTKAELVATFRALLSAAEFTFEHESAHRRGAAFLAGRADRFRRLPDCRPPPSPWLLGDSDV